MNHLDAISGEELGEKLLASIRQMKAGQGKVVSAAQRSLPMNHPLQAGAPGPFRADQLHDGDRYELRNGHPIYCAPAGRDHAGRNLTGALALETDPDVDWAGVDAGYSPEPGTLHAPDVAVGPAGDEAGWIPGVPPLAVEYAAAGQDQRDLREKIADLLRRGTQQVWVVRLVGSRRVEVHRPGQPVRLANPGEVLEAPGILRNPVPVEALYDRAAAHRVVLRNLLQRAGYESLEAVLKAGIEQGIEQGVEQGVKQGIQRGQARLLRRQLERRFGALPDWVEPRLAQATADQLETWSERVLDGPSLEAVFAE